MPDWTDMTADVAADQWIIFLWGKKIPGWSTVKNKKKIKKKFKSHAAVSCDIVHLLTTKPLHAFVSVRNIKYSWTDTSSLVPIAMEQIT